MARARDDLPLVDQVGVASQRRCAPGVTGDANACVRQGLGAHSYFHTGCHAGLAAVNAGHTEAGHPLAPSAVGQNHGLGHHQVEWGTALAGTNQDSLLACGRRVVVGTIELETVVRTVEAFGLAAHHLAPRLKSLRQTPEKTERGTADRHIGMVARVFAFEPFPGDAVVQLVMPQVDQDRHALQLGFGFLHLQRVFAEGHIQGHGRAITTFDQGVGLHHAVGQHGDLVARHIDRRQALTPQLVNRAARRQGQSRCRNVDAHRDRAAAQALQRQGVINFSGVRIVNRKSLHRG